MVKAAESSSFLLSGCRREVLGTTTTDSSGSVEIGWSRSGNSCRLLMVLNHLQLALKLHSEDTARRLILALRERTDMHLHSP
jgi:hypothetical protein